MTHGPEATADDLVSLADRGDPGAQRVLTDAGRALGRALAGLCTVLDPAMVVLGGKAAASSEPLLTAVRATLAGSVTPMRRGGVPVVTGALGERAEVLGAVALVSQQMPLH